MSETSTNGLFANLNQTPAETPAPEAPETETNEAPAMTELDFLKQRARLMGITFSNAIKIETLKAKIQAKLDGEAQAEEKAEDEPVAEEPVSAAPVAQAAPARKMTLREQLVAEQMALVRCRIQNLDPKKANLPGEIFTVANEFIGSVKKYIPYGEATDDGYHIPVCIYNQLVDRTFVQIKTIKNKNGRGTTQTYSDAREFSIEVLPQLTRDELARLASAQAAAAGN